MTTRIVAAATALILCAGMLSNSSGADDRSGNRDDDRSGKHLRANLKGFRETPSVSTPARGTFRAKVSDDRTQIDFELTYSDLVADALFAHIHFGQKDFPGGVAMFLCDNSATPSSPRTCPLRGGTVTGTLTAADVIGPTGQGIAAGEFTEVLKAIGGGVTYVNVHSGTFPAGEIRGQIGDNRHGHDHHDH